MEIIKATVIVNLLILHLTGMFKSKNKLQWL